MTELEQYIKSYFGVHQSDIKHISSLFKSCTLKKDDYLLKTGKSCNQLCFVKSGLLRIYVSQESKEITQWISTTGYFVTDLSSLILIPLHVGIFKL